MASRIYIMTCLKHDKWYSNTPPPESGVPSKASFIILASTTGKAIGSPRRGRSAHRYAFFIGKQSYLRKKSVIYTRRSRNKAFSESWDSVVLLWSRQPRFLLVHGLWYIAGPSPFTSLSLWLGQQCSHKSLGVLIIWPTNVHSSLPTLNYI